MRDFLGFVCLIVSVILFGFVLELFGQLFVACLSGRGCLNELSPWELGAYAGGVFVGAIAVGFFAAWRALSRRPAPE
jgi:hypothetical protein